MKLFSLSVLLTVVSASAYAQTEETTGADTDTGITVPSLPGTDKTNFIEVFADSNHLDCVELNIDGISVHGIARLSGVTFYASPILSHYVPDLLVTAYPRLGDSPLLESFAALGSAQNIISEPIVELLSGADAPDTYGQRDEWGGSKGTDAGDRNSKTLAYYEAEVFGHPGNVFSWASRAFRNESLFDVGASAAIFTQVFEDAQSIPQRAQSAVTEVVSSATTLGSHFSLDAIQRIDPVELVTDAFLGEVASLFASTGIGSAISTIQGVLPDSVEESVVGSIVDFGADALGDLVQPAAEQAQEDITQNAAGENVFPFDPEDPEIEVDDTESTGFSLSGLGDDAIEAVQGELAQLTPEAISERITEEVEGLVDQVAEITDLFNTLRNFGTDLSTGEIPIPGLAVVGLPFNGMCPSDVEPFFPYYLSGTNILSWRYKIPEIVYPQTYIPFSNSTTVGTLFPGGSLNPLARNLLSDFAEIQNYGSVYPRNGYMLQAHPLKAAAVAAFRAAHVVTRPGQPHIYRHPAPGGHDDFFLLEPGYDVNYEGDPDRDAEPTYLQPDVPESGRWQVVHNPGGEQSNQCQRFGAPETNRKLTVNNPAKLIGEIPNFFTNQWADDKKSDDNSYVFAMWRRYRCAQRESSNGIFTANFFVYNIQFDTFGESIRVFHNNELGIPDALEGSGDDVVEPEETEE